MEQPFKHNPAASSPGHVRKILRRHGPFMVAAAAGLSLLYGEEAWAMTQFWSKLSSNSALILGGALVLLTFVGNVLAFLLPPRTVRPEDSPRPVGAFAAAAGMGMGMAVMTNIVAFVLLLVLVSFNLEASSIVLKDVYIYVLLTVLFHALLYYVRHMHWLYDEFGGADSPFKPIAASGGIAAMLFILIIVFLPMDIQSIQAAPAALRGVTSLHTYLRDLYLISLALGAYVWHMRWIADH